MAGEWIDTQLSEIAARTERAFAMGPFGSNIRAENYCESGVPVIRGTNLGEIGQAAFKANDFVFLTEEKADQLASANAYANDIVFVAQGTVGKVGIIPPNTPYRRFVLSQNLMKVTVDPDQADARFIFYFFRSSFGQHEIMSRVNPTGVPCISKPLTSLRQFGVRIPSDVNEQRAIAHILGTLDDKIELNRRMNETLEAMARALFKSWFVNFDPVRAKAEGRDPGLPQPLADLFPDSFVDSELGEIPKGWEISTIGSVADVIDCLHSKKPERREAGMPLLQLANIRDDGLIDMQDTYFINEDDYRKWVSRMEASPGDCVITNVGRVGAVAQMPVGEKAALGRNMTGVRCMPTFPFPTVLIECLLSQAMKDEIVLKMDSGTILDALNVRNIPRLRFVRPRTGEILEHCERKMRPLRAQMERNLAESRTLAALRDTLLPKLMSGQLRERLRMRAERNAPERNAEASADHAEEHL